MEKSLSWKKGFFKSTYELYSSDGTAAGKLKENYWGNTAEGEIYLRMYHFKMRGFWNKKAEILDLSTGEVLATIVFNCWKSKATIEFTKDPGKAMTFGYENFWHTKWNISEPSGLSVRFQGTESKGQIRSDLDDILILAGLYIANYNWKMASTAVVAG
jgi:hypothetical protein